MSIAVPGAPSCHPAAKREGDSIEARSGVSSDPTFEPDRYAAAYEWPVSSSSGPAAVPCVTTWFSPIALAVSESGPGCGTNAASR